MNKFTCPGCFAVFVTIPASRLVYSLILIVFFHRVSFYFYFSICNHSFVNEFCFSGGQYTRTDRSNSHVCARFDSKITRWKSSYCTLYFGFVFLIFLSFSSCWCKWKITKCAADPCLGIRIIQELVSFRQSSTIAVWNSTRNNSNLFSLNIPNSSKCERIAYEKKTIHHKWMCGLLHSFFSSFSSMGNFAWFTLCIRDYG